jgi:hypothetical protein
MSTTENFVSRWSRLKREPEAAPKAELPPVEAEALEGEPRALVDVQPVGEVEPAFDPASLPSIESIGIDTDIRGFLQPRVPLELARAALRQAWASDPAIRDFIGIAENQWDFNDQTSIFGFGPMRATDNVPALLAQALGKLEDIAEKVIATADPVLTQPDAAANGQRDLPPVTEAALQAGDDSPIPVAARDDPVAVADELPRRPRQHGGALPQ